MAKGVPPGLGAFRAALLIGWVVLSAAGAGYARFKNIPNWAAIPVIGAFLVAYPFYLVPAFPTLRERLAGRRLPAYLIVSAVLPYLVGCLGGLQFHWNSLARLLAMALVFTFWYRILPRAATVDVAFLALIPLVLLGKYLESVYIASYPGLRREVILIGHVTLIQLAITALLLERRVNDAAYGFMPTWKDWRIGARHYLYFAVIGFPLALALGAVHFSSPAPVWKVAGTFLAFLWVIGLSEEFLVRGVLLQWIEDWTWSSSAALVITSCLFGMIHIGFGYFPNWRWVAVATLLGWFCGRARTQAGSIRAGVVTHALAVTTWRAFFV